MRKVIPSLNGIRAICIISVIGSHAKFCSNFPGKLEQVWDHLFNGNIGVNIFFTLSGFLITHLLILEERDNGKISLKQFYIRRILRIFPVYFLLLLTYFLLQVFHVFYFSTMDWVTSLTYTKNFGYGQFVDGHLWSLAVEEQFYLIWPFLFRFVSREKRIWILISTIILCPVVRALSYKYLNTQFTLFSFFTNVDCIMIGCLGAIFLPEIINILKRINPNILRSGCILLIIITWYLQLHFIAGIITLPLAKTFISFSACLLIISFGFTPSGFGYKFLNLRAVNYLGILSYSIYIWQQMFFDPVLGNFSALPVNYLMIFAVAFVSYNFIEKPILKLKAKHQVKPDNPQHIQLSNIVE